MQIDSTNLFPNPAYRVKLNVDIENIINTLYLVKKQDPKGNLLSNKGGWQSHSDLFNRVEFNELINEIKLVISAIFKVKDYQIKDLAGWGNISSKYHYNIIHTHSENLPNNKEWSGVFYVKCSKDSGGLQFHNPINISNGALNFPSTGDLYIFPAYMPHSVEANLSNEDRISIAFNFKL